MSWIYRQTTMTWLYVGLAIVTQLMMTRGLKPSLDCPVNDDQFRCCTSDELPKGCKCFGISKDSDFTNSMGYKPQCPADLGVEFHLYTRENRQRSFLVRSNDQSLSDSAFNGTKLTKFITHGYTHDITAIEFTNMKDALLEYADMNVVLVSWKKGAEYPNYWKASANVRSVGAMVAQMVQVMVRDHGLSLDAVHCIGHNLGAHVCGSAGKEVESLELEEKLMARITGLDATCPHFEGYSKMVRLDKTDAVFVDVIHTSNKGLLEGIESGVRYPFGTVDFFPNRGQLYQSYCHVHEMYGLVCNHMIGLDHFTDSILKCEYTQSDVNTSCVMGYHANSFCTGVISPETTKERPYCIVLA